MYIVDLSVQIRAKVSVKYPLNHYVHIYGHGRGPVPLRLNIRVLKNTRNKFPVPKNIEIDNLYDSIIELKNNRYYGH